ncbi:hypothetical protein [Acidipila rosea]|uniref:Uncharacterized protein n=1 Tax=Acidipila rosea TaxID=768535 RepID=A0A4R1LC21_9BACT|nr:hypothetical protein [Acidipila rosea]MBW4025986.1 hypothetical protein [Acidobacteriota bacterium]MBW4044095.1 hypothetical protein [Acidobacteriota bacterium]TCK75932.1 hypothetical protein C7378_0935 [Acidipila rosea]
MANMLIPAEERNMTPNQVEALEKRRQWGLNYQVIAGQFFFFAVLLTLWSGQDATYSPGWVHPMFYYNVFAVLAGLVCATYGTYLKRGKPTF